MAAGAVWPDRMVRFGRLFTARTWHILEVITFLLFSATVALGTSGWTRARTRSSESQQR